MPHTRQPEDSSPNRDSNPHNTFGGRLGKQMCYPLHRASPHHGRDDVIERHRLTSLTVRVAVEDQHVLPAVVDHEVCQRLAQLAGARVQVDSQRVRGSCLVRVEVELEVGDLQRGAQGADEVGDGGGAGSEHRHRVLLHLLAHWGQRTTTSSSEIRGRTHFRAEIRACVHSCT